MPCLFRLQAAFRQAHRLHGPSLNSARLPPCRAPRSSALPLRRRAVLTRASSQDPPETVREALDQGLDLCSAKRWAEAMPLFEKALSGTLPGTGVKRFRDRPKLMSDGEKMTALYNIACCQAQLGDVRAGLMALAGCLEAGYSEVGQIRSDPDLAPLREDPRFEGLLTRFGPKKDNLLGGFDLSGLFGGGGAANPKK